MRNIRASNRVLQNFYRRYVPLALFSVCAVTCAASQTFTPETVAADPVALVRKAAADELKPSDHNHPYRYRLRKVDDGRITIKEIVETKDGDVARLIGTGDKPLNPDANQTELERLNNLLAHPEIQERRRKREQADSNRADEMVRLLPDAFLYAYLGTAEGKSGPAYRLSLKPNPSFRPPSREAEVYAGMAGELWIDQKQQRMVKLDVHLIADVNFGWGILGKLYKGGSILVEQADVGNDHWEQYHFKLDLHGKALMIKTIDFETTEDESDFVPVPAGWGYQDAIKLLLTLPPSEIGPSSGTTEVSQR
jgi:hypothetical protein